MMFCHFFKTRQRFLISTVLFGSLIGAGAPGLAQQAQAESAVQAIKSSVHLRLGATTVSGLTAEISEQTGLKIKADPTLAAHRILVQLDDVSAETALQTLADLNGWEVTHPRAGYYRIRPRPILIPQKTTDIPTAFQTAMPMDLRRYLGQSSEQQNQLQTSVRSQQFNEGRLRYLREQDEKRNIKLRNQQRLDLSTQTLIQTLMPLLEDRREHLYKELSPQQKENLLTHLITTQLNMLNLALLRGELIPFQIDPGKAELTLKDGKMLMVNSTTRLNGGMHREGFGAPIKALTPPPATP